MKFIRHDRQQKQTESRARQCNVYLVFVDGFGLDCFDWQQ